MSNCVLFDQIASRITARQIEDPVPAVYPIDANVPYCDLEEGKHYIVTGAGWPVGWFPYRPCCDWNIIETADGLEFKPAPSDPHFPARDAMRPLVEGAVVDPATPYSECVNRLANSEVPFLVVSDGVESRGVIEYEDLFRPAGRLCLLALVQDLETAMIELLQGFQDECWDSLPREKTITTFRRRYLERQPELRRQIQWAGWDSFTRVGASWRFLLASTTLTDKVNMIRKGKLLASGYNTLMGVGARATRLRDACVHPTGLERSKHRIVPPPEIKRADLAKFIRDCDEMVESLVRHTAPSGFRSLLNYE